MAIVSWILWRTDVGVSSEAARQAAAFACLHYRKPKRIRTAFSPTQLVRLEEAFDSNQYVVGQERKDLAATLSLTETQVGSSVWYFIYSFISPSYMVAQNKWINAAIRNQTNAIKIEPNKRTGSVQHLT